MRTRTIGKGEERKILLAISQKRGGIPRSVFRFFANVAFLVIGILAICIATMSSWPIVALAAGSLVVGLLVGYVVGWYAVAQHSQERWVVVEPHLNMESITARLNELGA